MTITPEQFMAQTDPDEEDLPEPLESIADSLRRLVTLVEKHDTEERDHSRHHLAGVLADEVAHGPETYRVEPTSYSGSEEPRRGQSGGGRSLYRSGSPSHTCRRAFRAVTRRFAATGSKSSYSSGITSSINQSVQASRCAANSGAEGSASACTCSTPENSSLIHVAQSSGSSGCWKPSCNVLPWSSATARRRSTWAACLRSCRMVAHRTSPVTAPPSTPLAIPSSPYRSTHSQKPTAATVRRCGAHVLRSTKNGDS